MSARSVSAWDCGSICAGRDTSAHREPVGKDARPREPTGAGDMHVRMQGRARLWEPLCLAL